MMRRVRYELRMLRSEWQAMELRFAEWIERELPDVYALLERIVRWLDRKLERR